MRRARSSSRSVRFCRRGALLHPNYKAQAFNSKLLEWTLVVYAFR